jgi:hypothetical protein
MIEIVIPSIFDGDVVVGGLRITSSRIDSVKGGI